MMTLSAAAGAQTLPPQERLCDPTFQDCRADILTYIRQEAIAIDMAFWLMTDARYSNELVNAWRRGVRIRILMDPRCSGAHPACTTQNDQLRAAGIPMRNRVAGGILHWKTIIFASQGQVEFSGANYAPFELSPEQPFVNFTDEVVYFTNDPPVVRSFMTKFDDLWTSTAEFANYANVSGPLTRLHPRNAIDPELNFAPDESYRSRALNAYGAEQQKIDVMMFRITDETHTDAMIQAHNRGIPIRLITDETEYRNPGRLWHAYNVDKLLNAGVQVRVDAHQGLNHAKAVMLHGSGLSIFGSSNWTSPSSDTQREHNYFTRKPWIFSWLTALFDRKWSNQTGFWETRPFVPLPPDVPAVAAPADGAAGVATTGASLQWYAGPWAHNYDIHLGVTPDPPLMAANRRLGPSQSSTDYRTFPLPPLLPGTRYYWRVVSKTMAFVASEGPLWSFVTAGTAPPSGCTYWAGGGYRFSAAAVAEFEVPFGGPPAGAGCPLLVTTAAPWVRIRHVPSSAGWAVLMAIDANSGPSPRTALVGDPGSGFTITQAGTVPQLNVAGDFDGDGAADPALVFDGQLVFARLRAGGSSHGWQPVGSAATPNRTHVLMGDYDGDGWSEIATFAASTGVWQLTPSSLSHARNWGVPAAGGSSAWRIVWGGSAADVPVPADYDGDGVTDLAFYRRADRYWYIRESRTRTARYVRWGAFDDEIQLPADYDGDGRADAAFYRRSDRCWYILRSRDGRAMYIQWGGASTDVPAPADFDGDGRADAAFYRPADRFWYIRSSSTGAAHYVNWGADGALPMPADYDGDGRADVAFFRPFDRHWYIIDSSTGRARYLGDGTGPHSYAVIRVTR